MHTIAVVYFIRPVVLVVRVAALVDHRPRFPSCCNFSNRCKSSSNSLSFSFVNCKFFVNSTSSIWFNSWNKGINVDPMRINSGNNFRIRCNCMKINTPNKHPIPPMIFVHTINTRIIHSKVSYFLGKISIILYYVSLGCVNRPVPFCVMTCGTKGNTGVNGDRYKNWKVLRLSQLW